MYSLRTISSFTRWNERAKSNLRSLAGLGSATCHPIVVNKVGQPLLDFVASNPDLTSAGLLVVPGGLEDGYSTWTQFKAADSEWTICLHDDDQWRGNLPPQDSLYSRNGQACLLPLMYPDVDPDQGLPSQTSGVALDTTDCLDVVCRLEMYGRHPQPTMFGFTPSRAWNTWCDFVASRSQHLPHFDWQLNYANVFSNDILTYSGLAYYRDSSQWSSRASSAASLKRTYTQLGLPESWAQIDGILNRMNSVSLLAHAKHLTAQEIMQLSSRLTGPFLSNGRADRALGRLPRNLRRLASSLFPVAGRLNPREFPNTSALLESFPPGADVGTIRRLVIPALHKDDPRLESFGILDEITTDLETVLGIIASVGNRK